MRVLMLSTDRGFVGGEGSGDTVARHKRYAEHVDSLDVVVSTPGGFAMQEHSSRLRAFPTNTSKVFHLLGVLRIARRLFAEHQYDLIVAQDLTAPAGEMLKEKYGAPLIIGLHSMFFERGTLPFNGVNQWGAWRIKRALPYADGFRVNTERLRAHLRAWGLTQPVLVQPTPVDLAPFQVTEKNRNIVPVILYVGRLSPEKNVELLIRAVVGLKTNEAISYKLRIVGDGPERQKLESLTKELGVEEEVTFLGPKSYSELPAIYKEADIFVLPSNTESFGKVLLEAGAAKCAIIATETAGAKTILTNEKDALIIPVGNQKALQTALGGLISDVGRQESLGLAAAETARQYNAAEGVERTVQFWQEIVGKVDSSK